MLGVCSACMYVYLLNAWCPQRSPEGIGTPGARVIHGCEPLNGCWASTPAPPEEQPVLALTYGTISPVQNVSFRWKGENESLQLNKEINCVLRLTRSTFRIMKKKKPSFCSCCNSLLVTVVDLIPCMFMYCIFPCICIQRQKCIDRCNLQFQVPSLCLGTCSS